MRKCFIKFFLIFLIISLSLVHAENNIALEKNSSTNDSTEEQKEKGYIGILPFFLTNSNLNSGIIGISLFFNSKPYKKFLFNISTNIGIDNSFKSIVYKSGIFNVIYNICTKSYVSSDIGLSIHNFYDSYEYYSIFIQQSYGYRITDKLLYNLGFEYFYYSYSTSPKKYNMIRLFTEVKYDIGKLLFNGNKQFLKINVGSKLFYDFIDNIGLITNLNIFNNVRFETGKNIGNDSFGVLFYFDIEF